MTSSDNNEEISATTHEAMALAAGLSYVFKKKFDPKGEVVTTAVVESVSPISDEESEIRFQKELLKLSPAVSERVIVELEDFSKAAAEGYTDEEIALCITPEMKDNVGVLEAHAPRLAQLVRKFV